MCGPLGIKGLAKALAGKGGGVGALTSGGFEGATGASGLSAARAMGVKRKAAKLPIVPLLGATEEAATGS